MNPYIFFSLIAVGAYLVIRENKRNTAKEKKKENKKHPYKKTRGRLVLKKNDFK